MQRDAELLRDLSPDSLLLHLYEWEGDCLTYGHFIDVSQYLRLDNLAKLKLGVARRPTGGGISIMLTPLKAIEPSMNGQVKSSLMRLDKCVS